MATWQNFLDGADGLAGIYAQIKLADSYDDYQPSVQVEQTAPQPDPDREPVTAGGFQGLSEFGLQSSLGVVGLIAFVYLLASR